MQYEDVVCTASSTAGVDKRTREDTIQPCIPSAHHLFAAITTSTDPAEPSQSFMPVSLTKKATTGWVQCEHPFSTPGATSWFSSMASMPPLASNNILPCSSRRCITPVRPRSPTLAFDCFYCVFYFNSYQGQYSITTSTSHTSVG